MTTPMSVTFLSDGEGKRSLAKEFIDGKFQPYPMIKNVTSHEKTIVTLTDAHTAILHHAHQGHCLLKGHVNDPLSNESRAGKIARHQYTSTLVLDIDGLEVPGYVTKKKYKKSDVKQMAEQVVNLFPAAIKNTSYIAQASASTGFKKNQISLHIIMLLTVPVEPKTLKLWLKFCNYIVPTFEEQIELSVNGHSLKHTLDISVADNSKLIFIAPPVFNDSKDNPFINNDDRIVLINKKSDRLDLAKLINSSKINAQTNFQLETKIKNELRKKAGLNQSKEKITSGAMHGQIHSILENPDKGSIHVVDVTKIESATKDGKVIERTIVRCNINNGNSNAYWFDLADPRFMHNFKGEPIFEIEKMDSDFYQGVFDRFKKFQSKEKKNTYPVVFRDYNTDRIFSGIYNPDERQFLRHFDLVPIKKESVESFMYAHGAPAPRHMPEGNVFFDPTDTKKEGIVLDPETNTYQINQYQRSIYEQNQSLPTKPLKFGEAIKIKNKCPKIYTLIDHMLGNGKPEFERFINWLAFIYQTKEKTGTAWVMTGVQGTGKGQFYYRVLRPIFGDEGQVPMKALENIEEQFNRFMTRAMFLVVDEFHMASAHQGANKMAAKLKNQITENTITIREMRTDQREQKSYTNFIFLTNKRDAIRLEEGDRRYNIAPRQETKLVEAHPKLVNNLDKIKSELQDFANCLSNFEYVEKFIRTPIVNVSKEEMRQLAMDDYEEFFQAIKDKDIEYFLQVFDIVPRASDIDMISNLETSKRYIKGWLTKYSNKEIMIKPDVLQIVFDVIYQYPVSKRLNITNFRKKAKEYLGAKANIQQRCVSHDNKPVRGVPVVWEVNKEMGELLNEKFDVQPNIS